MVVEDIRNVKSTEGMIEFEAQYHAPHCVVLDSEYCSMGRMIGNMACALSGYTYYDAVFLLDLVPESGVTRDDLAALNAKLRQRRMTKEELLNDEDFIKVDQAMDQAIDIALSKGPCLIHDRITKEAVIDKGYTCISVLTYGQDWKAKIPRAKVSALYQDLEDDSEVIAKIKEEDMIRINTHTAHADTKWGDKGTYDLLINIDTFCRDYSAQLLASTMKLI